MRRRCIICPFSSFCICSYYGYCYYTYCGYCCFQFTINLGGFVFSLLYVSRRLEDVSKLPPIQYHRRWEIGSREIFIAEENRTRFRTLRQKCSNWENYGNFQYKKDAIYAGHRISIFIVSLCDIRVRRKAQ